MHLLSSLNFRLCEPPSVGGLVHTVRPARLTYWAVPVPPPSCVYDLESYWEKRRPLLRVCLCAYSWRLNNMGLNDVGPPAVDFFQ